MIPSREQLGGLSYERAELMGKPHIRASYTGSGDKHSIDAHADCAICGRAATEAHHMVPKGMGGGSRVFMLRTEMGVFPLRSPLIAVCGRGNTSGCHGLFERKLLRAYWFWDSKEYEDRWWSGWFLSHGIPPHSPLLYEYGSYIIEDVSQKAVRTYRNP